MPPNALHFINALRGPDLAALVTRLESLRRGAKGAMLDVSRSLPVAVLFQRPTVVELTSQPCVVNAPVSLARLLHVHRNGDIGSPRVSGSTNASNAAVRPGWVSPMLGRPAPARRIRVVGATPAASSRRPVRIVSRASPVAADTSASPP